MSTHNKANYANIKAIGHDKKALQRTMKRRYRGELSTLNAVNDLAGDDYDTIVDEQRKWSIIKYLALFVSFVGLLITLLINFASPMIEQEKYEYSDPRVWVLLAVFTLVALAGTTVIDVGRTWVLRSSNNGFFAWTFFALITLFSLTLTTTGNLAVADYFESKANSATTKSVADAKKYMIEHAGMAGKSTASIDEQQSAYDKKLHTKKSGYYKADHARDTARLNAERQEIKDYNSAVAVVNGKAAIQATDESSNWLFNVVAKIGGYSSVIKAGIIISLLFNIAFEIMSAFGQGRLVKLNARLRVTEKQWSAAEMAANKAMIVSTSKLQPLNELDVFQHTFGMPIPLLNQYRSNGKAVGDFIQAEWEDYSETSQKNPTGTGGRLLGDPNAKNENAFTDSERSSNSVEKKVELYAIAKKAKSGTNFLCPTCETDMIKRGNKIFCTNSKNKHSDGTNCSDEYHNETNPKRKQYLLKHSKA